MSDTPRFNGPDHSGPAAFIRSYCADYTLWNDHCHHALETAGTKDKHSLRESFTALYHAFSTLYIAEGTNLQNISFGSHSTFAPDRVVLGKLQDGDPRIVQHFYVTAHGSNGRDEFFAILERGASGTLVLHQIYYVDPFPEDLPEGENDFLPYL